jgi:hypothetical protein
VERDTQDISLATRLFYNYLKGQQQQQQKQQQ